MQEKVLLDYGQIHIAQTTGKHDTQMNTGSGIFLLQISSVIFETTENGRYRKQVDKLILKGSTYAEAASKKGSITTHR